MTDFYSIPETRIDGGADLLGPLRGQVTLAVNVASRCGYTPQYAGLERLYRDLKDQRFTVVDFPCNRFGRQEPGSEAEIQQFCQRTDDVIFPLSVQAGGQRAGPASALCLSHRAGERISERYRLELEKFLIGRSGQVLRRYGSGARPEDRGLAQDTTDAL